MAGDKTGSWAQAGGQLLMQGASYRALEVLPKPLPREARWHLWSQVGGTWEKGSGRGWGGQKPRLHTAKHLSFNPDSTVTSCVTSLNKLLQVTSSIKNLTFLFVGKPGNSPTSKGCWDVETG